MELEWIRPGWMDFNPFTPRYHYLFSLLSAISLSLCLFWEFGSGSANHALIYIFLYSHHLSAWYCIDIIRLILSWSLMGVKGLTERIQVGWSELEKIGVDWGRLDFKSSPLTYETTFIKMILIRWKKKWGKRISEREMFSFYFCKVPLDRSWILTMSWPSSSHDH